MVEGEPGGVEVQPQIVYKGTMGRIAKLDGDGMSTENEFVP